VDLFALATLPIGADEAGGPPPQVLRATGQPLGGRWVSSPIASLIVRVKDEARGSVARLSSCDHRASSPKSSSWTRDRRMARARSRELCDKLMEIPPGEFTYGRALKVGAQAASADVHFAISAHCLPRQADWIKRSLATTLDPTWPGQAARAFSRMAWPWSPSTSRPSSKPEPIHFGASPITPQRGARASGTSSPSTSESRRARIVSGAGG
jgi:hypothetical protein